MPISHWLKTIGMEVPERELVEQSEFEGIPKEFETLSDGRVLLVKRFDRGVNGERIHIEISRRYSASILRGIQELHIMISPQP